MIEFDQKNAFYVTIVIYIFQIRTVHPFQMLDGRRCVQRCLPRPNPFLHDIQHHYISGGDERDLQHSTHVRKGQSVISLPGHSIGIFPSRAKLVVRWFSGNCRNVGLTLPLYNHVLVPGPVHFSAAWNYQERFPRRLALVRNESSNLGTSIKSMSFPIIPRLWYQWGNVPFSLSVGAMGILGLISKRTLICSLKKNRRESLTLGWHYYDGCNAWNPHTSTEKLSTSS